jgi:hypothetical protein
VAFFPFPNLMIGSSLNSTAKPTTALLLIGTIAFTSYFYEKNIPGSEKHNTK